MISVKTIIKHNLWIAVITAISSILLIALALSLYNPSTISVPKGAYIKNGSRIFYNYLEQIKEKNGILVLGTSETGNDLNGNNYYSILNKDKEFNRDVYSLGGAGRSANVYFPLILDNPSAFNNLEIIYYINPTYWRFGLNKFSEGYFTRYVNQDLLHSVKAEAQEKKLYNFLLKDNDSDKDRYQILINRLVDNFKSLFYHNLPEVFSPSKATINTKVNLDEVYNTLKINDFKSKINLENNVTEEFLTKGFLFPAIDTTSNYQNELLKAFIELTKEYNINCKFYLGPYNEIYCNKMSPLLKKEHQNTIANIKEILKKSGVQYIDGSDLSTVPGTFIDIQHISEYGAFLTANQIKEYYEKSK